MALYNPRMQSIIAEIQRRKREREQANRGKSTVPESGRSVPSVQQKKTYDFGQAKTATPSMQQPTQQAQRTIDPRTAKVAGPYMPVRFDPVDKLGPGIKPVDPNKDRKLNFKFAKDPVTGQVKDYSQISLADVYTSFYQAPADKRQELEKQFEVDYLKKPGNRYYSPYYAKGTNNADFVKYFGTDNIDDVLNEPAYREKLLPHIRWNANGTSPLKPGKKSSQLEWAAYTYFYADQDAKESRAVQAEQPALYSQLNDLVSANQDATEDEIIAMIDWDATDDNGEKSLKMTKSFRDAADVGGAKKTANGGLLIDNEPLRAAIRAGKSGEDISIPRDYVALEAAKRQFENIDKPEAMKRAGIIDDKTSGKANPDKPKGFFEFFAESYLPNSAGILGNEGAPGMKLGGIGKIFPKESSGNPVEQSIASTGYIDLRDTRIPQAQWSLLADAGLASPDQVNALTGGSVKADESTGMVSGAAMKQSTPKDGVMTVRNWVDYRAALQDQLNELDTFNAESKASAIQGEIDKLENDLANGADPETTNAKLQTLYEQLGGWTGSADDAANRDAAKSKLQSEIMVANDAIVALRAAASAPKPEPRSEYVNRMLYTDVDAEQRQIDKLTQIDNEVIDQYNVLVNRIADADRVVGGYPEAAAKADPELWGAWQQRNQDVIARDQLIAQMAELGVDITDPTKISNDILKKKMELRDAAMFQAKALPIIESADFGGDYDLYSATGLSLKNPEPTLSDYAWNGGVPGGIQNLATYARDHADDIIAIMNHNSSFRSEHINDLNDMVFMSDEQVATYSYYLANPAYGKKRADLYFEGIRPLLRSIQGEGLAKSVEGHPVWELGVSAAAGIERGGIGLAQLFNDDPIPRTQLEFAYPLVSQDLGKFGPKLPDKLGGRSLMQVLGDTAYAGGNMVPAIAASAAVPGVGPVVIGAGAAGNTYRDAIYAGRSRDGAMKRAVLTGIAEGGLGWLLGVGAAGGGKIAQMVGSKTANAMRGAFSDGVKGIALTMASNGTEEYLQDILSPVFDKLAYDDRFKGIDFADPEAVYSGLLGALTAVITDTPDIVGKIYGTSKVGAEFNTPERIADLILTGQAAPDGSKAQSDAMGALERIQKKGSIDALGNYRTGKLAISVGQKMAKAVSAPLEQAPEIEPEPETPVEPEEPAPETADKIDPAAEIELNPEDIAAAETAARTAARAIIEDVKGFTGKLQRLYEVAQSVEKLYHDALRKEMTFKNKITELARDTGKIMQDVANGVIDSAAGLTKIMNNSRASADAKTEADNYEQQRIKLSEEDAAASAKFYEAKGELYRTTYETELNNALQMARQSRYEQMLADEAAANEAAMAKAENDAAIARQAEVEAQDADLANQEAAIAQNEDSLKRAMQQALDDETQALNAVDNGGGQTAVEAAENASEKARAARSRYDAAMKQHESITKKREAIAKERAELTAKIGQASAPFKWYDGKTLEELAENEKNGNYTVAASEQNQPSMPEMAKADSSAATAADAVQAAGNAPKPVTDGIAPVDREETPADKIKRFLESRYPHAQVDPKALLVDPETYQFRGGVDKNGVTKPITGSYKPLFADDIVVHRRLNGEMYVADGHHRREFAIRNGVESVDVIILDEADGVTTEDARMMAAARNMSQNHGEPLDAAKVFRDAGVTIDDIAEFGLTATNSVVEKGYSLSKLAGEYWKRIVSGNLDEFTGYVMGKYFPDDGKMQAQFMRFLGQKGGSSLSNGAKEELAKILTDADKDIDDPDKQFSFDFFDNFDTNALQIADLASRVKNKLARIHGLFKSLSSENKQAVIEAVGQNRIDAEANDAKAGNISIAATLMQSYATKGAVHDIINRYAKDVAEKRIAMDKAADAATQEIVGLATKGGLVIGGVDNTQTSIPVVEGTGQADKGKQGIRKENKGKPETNGSGETLSLQSAVTPMRSGTSPSAATTKADQEIVKRASDIAKELYSHFDQVSTTKNQSKDMREGKTLGSYELHSGAVNTRTFQSVVVYAHELGHAIFEKAHVFDAHGQPSPEFKADIDAMVNNLPAWFGQSYPADALPREASAEFVRNFLMDRNHAVAFASEAFVRKFETQMLTAPQLRAMQKARGQFGALLLAEPLNQRIARIDYGDSNANAFDGSFGRLVQGWADKYYSVLRFDEAANKLGYDNKDAKKRAYVAFSNIAYSITQAGNIVNHGLVTPEGVRRSVLMKDGRKIAGSFGGIMNQITKEQQPFFDTYLLSLHDIDRQAQGKPVYGDYTAKDSQQVVDDLKAQYPHFEKVQQELVRWWDAFIDEWVVKTNAIENAAEKVKLFRDMYPNYVPTYRSKSDRVDVMEESFGDMGGLIGQASVHFKRAKGSDEALKSPVLSFVIRIGEIVTATNKVLAMRRVHEAYRETPGLSNYIKDVTGQAGDNGGDELLRIIDENGDVHQYQVFDKLLYEALLQGGTKEDKAFWNAVGSVTGVFKQLTTVSNPIFAFSNAPRDFVEAFTKGSENNLLKFTWQWVDAIIELCKSGKKQSDALKAYYGAGGGDSSISPRERRGVNEIERMVYSDVFAGSLNRIRHGRNFKDRAMGGEAALQYVGAKLKDAINTFNNVVEGSQRFAEFKRTYNRTGDAGQAMYNSANVTTDFRRMGNSNLNYVARQVFAFMNAGIQGTYSWYRMAKEARYDKKAFAMKALKAAAMFAMVPLAQYMLIAMLGGDDEEAYNLLPDNIKEDNYLIPKYWLADRGKGADRFIKIPKAKGPIPTIGDAIGRSLTEAIRREGSIDAFIAYGAGDFAARKGTNLFDAINPFGSPVFAPIVQIMNNQTWYGAPLESSWMRSEGIAPSNRIKETTSSAAIWLANLPALYNRVSPIQVDYFLNQSFGIVGDYLTGDAGNYVIDKMQGKEASYALGSSTMRFIKSRLTTDPTAASDVTSALYDINDEIIGIVSDASQKGENRNQYSRLNLNLTDAEKKAAVSAAKSLTKKGGALYKAKKATTAHYNELEEIMTGKMTDEEKNVKVRAIKMQMLIENALAVSKAEEFMRKYVLGTPAQYERIYGK